MTPTMGDVKAAWSTVSALLIPPQTQAEYERLQDCLDQLEAETEEGSSLESLMDYLGELLDEYEHCHFHDVAQLDQETAEPSEVLRRFMKRQGLKQKDLISVFGTQSRVSEVLNGKRQITLAQVKKLHQQYHLPVDLFF